MSSPLKIPSGLNIALHQDPRFTPLSTVFNKPHNNFASKEAQVTPWQFSIMTLFNSPRWHCYFNCCYVQMAQCYPDMCPSPFTHQPGQSVRVRSDKLDCGAGFGIFTMGIVNIWSKAQCSQDKQSEQMLWSPTRFQKIHKNTHTKCHVV